MTTDAFQLKKCMLLRMTTMLKMNQETAEAYEYYDDDEAEPIKRSEGRFLPVIPRRYAVYHLVSNNLVDNSDHRQDLEDYILEEYAYEENFMRFLGNHVGIYISEYDYERYEREQNRSRNDEYEDYNVE